MRRPGSNLRLVLTLLTLMLPLLGADCRADERPSAPQTDAEHATSFEPVVYGSERSLSLASDLSGTARVTNVLDLTTFAIAAAMLARQEAGQKGDPTPAEIAKAGEKFAALVKSSDRAFPGWKAAVARSLPSGVKLIDAWQTTEGYKTTSCFRFGFDHVSKLAGVSTASPGESKPPHFSRPFAALHFVEQGDLLLVTSRGANPKAGYQDVYRLETPFEVLESNAPQRERNTLVWDYDPELAKSGKLPGEISAKLKRTGSQAPQG